VASSYSVGSRCGGAQFALTLPTSSVAVFRRDGFDRIRLVQHVRSVDDGSRWLPTPCALRLGEPDQAARSLTLSVAPWCFPCGLHPARAPSRHPPRGVRRRLRHGARTRSVAAPVRARPLPGPRAPSIGKTPLLRAKQTLSAFPLTFACSGLAPFHPRRAGSPCRGMSRRSVLSARPSVCLSAPLGACGKMLLTDFCNRHTTRAHANRSTPGHAAFAASTARTPAQTGILRGARPPCGDPTPGETRLTAHRQLRPYRTRAP